MGPTDLTAGKFARSTSSSPCHSQCSSGRALEPKALVVSDDEGGSVDRRAKWIAHEAQHKIQRDLPTATPGVPASVPQTRPPRSSSRVDALQFSLSQRSLPDPSVVTSDSLCARIDEVVPNLRDLAVSSCLPNMKAGRLFRSARAFSKKHHDIYDVFVTLLKIQTVIDLRDDDLSAIPEEGESRLLLAHFFPPHSITRLRPREVRTEATTVDPREPLPKTPPGINAYRKALAAAKHFPAVNSRSPDSSPKAAGTHSPTPVETRLKLDTFNKLREKRPQLTDSILLSLATDPNTMPLRDILLHGKDKARRMMIVNLFDTPAIRKRILMTLSNSVYAPVILFARATDKLAGTSMAPFYFCKYIMSAHDIYESYVEMIDNCGEVFAIALKIIALAEAPLLFHCSLGKDRTGVLAMLILSILGAPESAILFDYSLTHHANDMYQAYNRKFIVTYSGLSEGFCTAKIETARRTLDYMKETWGSVALYLDYIGFDAHWRALMCQQYLF
eukprot:Gregarina_sp_Pseudo_9__5070@NODE_532_length_2631_cov_35_600694_g502_i0_p1_GENE_NODE_532_length_2631_cov_35_600694_g502_i0NODE_532_length_2631_cov_35_600694_g502_i0_p1_ORF_typecomplete_len502_score122_82Y_phosphatase3/PF13350_6/2_7e38Y_phosphatase2/PF03162_13/83Y_phosphatase2/PF03162_13/0_00029PTPlike_phytase/PF14566_6/0_093_NODE_532_length_2631_cov_35_600694_g502_i0791584